MGWFYSGGSVVLIFPTDVGTACVASVAGGWDGLGMLVG